MAAGITQQSKTVPGGSYEYQFLITGDASYPAGGYIITAALLAPFLTRIGKLLSYELFTFANGITAVVAVPTYSGGASPNIITQIAVRLFLGSTELGTGVTAVGTTVCLTIHGT